MTPEKSKKSLWGIGIYLLYGLFVIFTLVIVVFASMQDFHLVEKNYYQKELAYQTRIDEINNADELVEKPAWDINQSENLLTIQFPESIMDEFVSGDVLLYKTSEAGSDLSITLAPDVSGLQNIPLERLNRGLWKIKLSWKDNQKGYYLEDRFSIN